jgi:hypothetical protein
MLSPISTEGVMQPTTRLSWPPPIETEMRFHTIPSPRTTHESPPIAIAGAPYQLGCTP